MPLPTNVVSNGFTLTLTAAGGTGPVAYECAATQIVETVSTYGGEEIQTACGVLRTPIRSTITGITATIVEDLAAAGFFRRLRETPSAGTEIITYTGTTSATESATNPEWVATVSGWTKPVFTAQASGGYPTSTVEFTFVGEPTVDIT